VIVFALGTPTLEAGLPPNVTLATLMKFAPLIVTGTPPAVDPKAGEQLDSVGAGIGL
jgi:hypothetical protein